MVDKDQEIQEANNYSLDVIAKFIRWSLYVILFIVFVLPTIFLSYIYLNDEAEITELSFLRSYAEEKIEQQLVKYDVRISSAGIAKGEAFFSPKFIFMDVTVDNENEDRLYELPKVYTNLNLLNRNDKGSITIENAQLFLKRNLSGRLIISSDEMSKENLFERIDLTSIAFSKIPILNRFTKFHAENISIDYLDDKTKNNYIFKNGKFSIKKDIDVLSFSSTFDLIKSNSDISIIKLSGNHKINDETFEVIAKVEDADPLTLANQIPALDWLRNLETNVNASIITLFNSDIDILNMDGVIELEAGKLKSTPQYASTDFLHLKTYFDYDLNSDIFNFSNFEFKSKQLSANGSAKNFLLRDSNFNITGSKTKLKISEGKFNRPDIFENETISLKSGFADLLINIEPFSINLENSNIQSAQSNLILNGKLSARNDYWESDFNLEIDALDKQQIIDFWPINYNAKSRKWTAQNVNSSLISNIKGNLKSSMGVTNSEFTFDFDDTSINAIKSVVPLVGISGEGSLSDNQITFKLESGVFETSPGYFTNLSGSIFHIPNIKVLPANGQMKLNAKGKLKSFFEILDSDKFKYLEKAGFDSDIANGLMELGGWIEWPLIKGVSQEQVLFSVDGILSNIESDKIIRNRNIVSDSLALKASDEKLSIFGKSKIDNFPIEFSWMQNLKNNSDRMSTVDAKFYINQNGLDTFNVLLPEGMFSGNAQGNLRLSLRPKKPAKFLMSSNLKGAEININSLGWSNKSIKNGNLNIRGSLSTPIDINEIRILADDLNANGKVNFDNDSKFKSAVFPEINIADWFSTSLTVSKTDSESLMELDGGVVDFRKLVFGKSDDTEVGLLNVSLDSLRISEGIEFTNFSTNIDFSQKELGNFKAQINGGANIYGKLSKGEFGTIITLNGDDAGHVLRSAGILDNIRGGKLNLVLTPNEKNGYYTGRFITNKFRMLHSNPVALLLDSLSLVGLVDKLENEGIQFNQAKGWLNITPEGIQLRDVSLVGLSMGMSITGWYDKKKKAINFDGVITPVYAINGVFERLAGKLFGEQKGEGLFSFVYTMKGPTSSPIVKVKPLSILTPGGFRKIFRSDIPAPSK